CDGRIEEVPGGTTLQQLWRRHPTLCDGRRYFLVTHPHTQRHTQPHTSSHARTTATHGGDGASAAAPGAADDADVIFRPQDVLEAGACYRAEPVRGPLASMLAGTTLSQAHSLQDTATAPMTATIELPDGSTRDVEAGFMACYRGRALLLRHDRVKGVLRYMAWRTCSTVSDEGCVVAAAAQPSARQTTPPCTTSPPLPRLRSMLLPPSPPPRLPP
ncbi:unnamed protein product, partial [Closterium sp. Naga37s-1]